MENSPTMASYAVQGLPPDTFAEGDDCALKWDATRVAAERLCLNSGVSADAFRLLPAADKLAVLIWEKSQQPGTKVLVGAAAVSVDRKDRDYAAAVSVDRKDRDYDIRFIVHGFGAKTPALDQALYQLMDEAAFERGQLEYVRRTIAGDVVMPSMQFELSEGSCSTREKALLFVENGWQLWSQRMNVLSRIADPANATWDHSSIGPHAPKATSRLFDLELRAPTRALDTGYLYPTITASISQTANLTRMPAQVNLVGSNKYNLDIRDGTWRLGRSLLTPSMETGLASLVVPALTCRALEFFLCNSSNHGYSEEESYFPARFLRVGFPEQRLFGFSSYDNVQAPGGHNDQMQAARTFRTNTRGHVMALLYAAPGFAALASDVFERLGYPNPTQDQYSQMLKAVHFFCVDSSRQTSFDWHSDDTDLKLNSHVTRSKLRSAVIQLGAEGCTAMQMHGFHHYPFQGRGSGAIFHGAAMHRSINCVPSPKHGIWKVTLFIMVPE
jgi:hypothetical protein